MTNQPMVNNTYSVSQPTSTRIYLFSSREFHHIALRYVCGDGNGFTLQGISNALPENFDTLTVIKPDLTIIDTDLLRNRPSNTLETFLPAVRGITRIVLLADTLDISSLYSVMMSGVHGYILTSVSIDEFRQALRVVTAGGLWLGQDFAHTHAHQFVKTQQPNEVPSVARLLSQRERQILNRVAQGNTSKEIARAFFLSESSVRTYWYRVLSKLNALNKAEAIALAARLGLLDSDSDNEAMLLDTNPRLRAR